MQYPIIDNLIHAYQRNGWTGLTLTEGKNILDLESEFNRVGVTYSIEDGWFIIRKPQYPSLYNNRFYLPRQITGSAMIIINNELSTATSIRLRAMQNNTVIGVTQTGNPEYSILQNIKFNCISFDWVTQGTFAIKVMVSESPTLSYDEYEPYAPPTTDIKDRLKLPMIHYFPHPVIDALISAADGQPTEEEKEILRHYLTPLGIGGI